MSNDHQDNIMRMYGRKHAFWDCRNKIHILYHDSQITYEEYIAMLDMSQSEDDEVLTLLQIIVEEKAKNPRWHDDNTKIR